MSPIPSNRYHEAIFAVGIIKKVTGEKRQGGGTHPPGRPRVNTFKIYVLNIFKIYLLFVITISLPDLFLIMVD